MDSTVHKIVQGIQYQATQQFSYLQQELAADLSEKENNCIISIVGKHSNVTQVAPRTTREGPYLYCHLSYTNFLQVQSFLGIVYPRKGGVKEMPVQK